MLQHDAVIVDGASMSATECRLLVAFSNLRLRPYLVVIDSYTIGRAELARSRIDYLITEDNLAQLQDLISRLLIEDRLAECQRLIEEYCANKAALMSAAHALFATGNSLSTVKAAALAAGTPERTLRSQWHSAVGKSPRLVDLTRCVYHIREAHTQQQRSDALARLDRLLAAFPPRVPLSSMEL